jgi:hypothetical protein
MVDLAYQSTRKINCDSSGYGDVRLIIDVWILGKNGIEWKTWQKKKGR